MLVKVKSLTGRTFEFDIDETNKVGTLKQLIETKIGVPTVQQKLLFNGRPMNDEKNYKEQNVTAGSIIHVVIALRGGRN